MSKNINIKDKLITIYDDYFYCKTHNVFFNVIDELKIMKMINLPIEKYRKGEVE